MKVILIPVVKVRNPTCLKAVKLKIIQFSLACQGVDVKFDVKELKKLEGCGIVEGSVQISQLEIFENVSFPSLHEITGRLVIIKVSGIKSVMQLFPNLVRIHGEELLENYAMILVDNPDLEEIGLSSLKRIKKGAVRVGGNDKLCYASTVNWSSVVHDDFLHANYFKVRFLNKNESARDIK